MARKCEAPAATGASRNSLAAFRNPDSPLSNSGQPFFDHRQTALALLNGGFRLTRMSGRFLGQLAVDPSPLTDAQADWLDRLLAKHGLPSLARKVGQ